MLIIAVIILLLAGDSKSHMPTGIHLAHYCKVNRIVLIVFILAGYLAYNCLSLDGLYAGVGIYDGVFKVSSLSQVFDIILFLTGAIVSLLTCFPPYHFRKYDDSKLIDYILLLDFEDPMRWKTDISFYRFNLQSYYVRNMILHYPYIDMIDRSPIVIYILNVIKKFSQMLPDIKRPTPFLVDKNKVYSKLEAKEYSAILLFTVIGGSLLISSSNLISLYLSLELQSFSLYILATSQLKSFKGTSGGLKYFLLGGLSSGFILLGCSLLYAYTGSLNLDEIFAIYSKQTVNIILDSCFLVLFGGLLFKIAAAPFHNWAPDVYADVPTYSTTWLISIAKISILVLMFLLIHNIFSNLNLNDLNYLEGYYTYKEEELFKSFKLGYEKEYKLQDIEWISSSLMGVLQNSFSYWESYLTSTGIWTSVLTISAILSLIIGTLLGITQSRIKRLFAYSTITHVGFLLLALSVNSIISLDAFVFYLIQYTITNLNLFFIIIAWGFLYSQYYLEKSKDFIPVKYLNLNPYSWKDLYVEPTLYDYLENINEQINELVKRTEEMYPGQEADINAIYDYILYYESDLYPDYKFEDSEWEYSPVPYILNFKGMYFTDPFLAFCLAVTLFSLAGIPPLIGFFAKQQVLVASLQLDYYFVTLIAIFTSVLGATYYLRIVKYIYFYDEAFIPYILKENAERNNDKNKEFQPKFIFGSSEKESNLSMIPSNNLSLVIAILTNVSLFFILKPYLLMNLISNMLFPFYAI
jgi:NADH:ubiquinone oxidoreductase subunit 2 (subunit N)